MAVKFWDGVAAREREGEGEEGGGDYLSFVVSVWLIDSKNALKQHKKRTQNDP